MALKHYAAPHLPPYEPLYDIPPIRNEEEGEITKVSYNEILEREMSLHYSVLQTMASMRLEEEEERQHQQQQQQLQQEQELPILYVGPDERSFFLFSQRQHLRLLELYHVNLIDGDIQIHQDWNASMEQFFVVHIFIAYCYKTHV